MLILRIGNGYDAHRLCEGRKLILGGVEIPFDKGLMGHSDADVLIHAVMDALLGALALGDIGIVFPDTDDKYKDASSLSMLEKVEETVRFAGYVIGNVDTVVIAQQPKLSQYVHKMRKSIADALGANVSQISVKATTEEFMGFTGEGKGIAAHAVCILERSK